MHVILCSDSTAVRQIAVRQIMDDAIEGAGRRLTTCESGMELLAAVRTLAADIVVLDLGTHGMGGSLLASAIRELAPGLPIVAVSANASADTRSVVQQGIPHVFLNTDGDGELQAVIAERAGKRNLALGAGSR